MISETCMSAYMEVLTQTYTVDLLFTIGGSRLRCRYGNEPTGSSHPTPCLRWHRRRIARHWTQPCQPIPRIPELDPGRLRTAFVVYGAAATHDQRPWGQPPPHTPASEFAAQMRHSLREDEAKRTRPRSVDNSYLNKRRELAAPAQRMVLPLARQQSRRSWTWCSTTAVSNPTCSPNIPASRRVSLPSPQPDRGSPPCHHNTVSHNTVTVYRRAVIAVAWGAATLHSADDGHDCPIPSSGDDTDPEAHHDTAQTTFPRTWNWS